MVEEIIQGVGKDEPIVVNEIGGKQSRSLYAPHLLDPLFLFNITEGVEEFVPLRFIAKFMESGAKDYLIEALLATDNDSRIKPSKVVISRLLTISRVLKEGADKYEANNWRLIPQEDHLSHALTHYLAYLIGDGSDDHLSHYYCRLMMAYSTEPSEGFSYTEYLKEVLTNKIIMVYYK